MIKNLNRFWNSIPTTKEEAVTISELSRSWHINQKKTRNILKQLVYRDNKDNYILVNVPHTNRYYRTNDIVEIKNYQKQCVTKAKKNLTSTRKIKRILTKSEKATLEAQIQAF